MPTKAQTRAKKNMGTTNEAHLVQLWDEDEVDEAEEVVAIMEVDVKDVGVGVEEIAWRTRIEI